MKSLLLIFVLVGVAVSKDCDYKGTAIKDGGKITPTGECVSVSCDNGNPRILPCPQIGIPHGCEVKYEGEDLTKPHPDCCAKAYC